MVFGKGILYNRGGPPIGQVGQILGKKAIKKGLAAKINCLYWEAG
jgi:hypothetical protein